MRATSAKVEIGWQVLVVTRVGERRMKKVTNLLILISIEVLFFCVLWGFLTIRSMFSSLVLVLVFGGLFYGLRHLPRTRSHLLGLFESYRKSATLLAVLLICTFPFLLGRSPYLIHLLLMCEIYALVAVGLNFQFGSLGLHSFGFAAFYGIGAYTSALLAVKYGVSFWLGMPIGGLVSAFFGILLGLPTLKVRTFYYALITLSFGVVFYHVLTHLSWAGGTNGIVNIPLPSIGGHSFEEGFKLFGISVPEQTNFFYLTLLLLIFGILVGERLYHSGVGLAWNSIYQDEIMAQCQGIDVARMKLLAFGLGSFYAGVAGAIRAHYVGFISPETFFVNVSILLVCMVVLGGSDNVLGVVLGSTVLTLIPEKFRAFEEFRMMLVGIVIILVLLFLPDGVLPKRIRKYPKVFGSFLT
jgi:ABC-type branched-subunit amino acid transport system permease subunit